MKPFNRKVTLGLIVSSRAFFNSAYAPNARADLIAAGAVVAPRRTDAARLGAPVAIWSGVRLDRALKELRG